MPPPSSRTDHELMEAVQGGDAAALEVLFARHHHRLFSYLSRLTRDDHAAEDLTQETFLRLLRYPERYERSGAFLAWLYRVSRNLAIDRHRRERDEPLAESESAIADDRPLLLDRMVMEEQHQALDDVLASLAMPHREILLLRGVEGLDHRDIGIALSCTEGTARVRLHRATAALRQAWFARHGEH